VRGIETLVKRKEPLVIRGAFYFLNKDTAKRNNKNKTCTMAGLCCVIAQVTTLEKELKEVFFRDNEKIVFIF
jgi:hypothetical protein